MSRPSGETFLFKKKKLYCFSLYALLFARTQITFFLLQICCLLFFPSCFFFFFFLACFFLFFFFMFFSFFFLLHVLLLLLQKQVHSKLLYTALIIYPTLGAVKFMNMTAATAIHYIGLASSFATVLMYAAPLSVVVSKSCNSAAFAFSFMKKNGQLSFSANSVGQNF